MNNNAKVLAQNTQGRFFQYWAAGKMGRIGRELFCKGEDTVFEMPDDGLKLTGYEAIAAWFDEEEVKASATTICRSVHLSHSHLSRFSEDGSLRAMWVTSSFDITGAKNGEDKAPYKMQYYFTRLDADMREEDGQMKYKNLMWYTLESMIPETYNPLLEPGLFTAGQALETPPAPTGATTAEDFLAIRNLQARFTLNNRRDALTDYADRDDVSLELPHLLKASVHGKAAVRAALVELEERERQNEGLYLSVPAQYAPVIEVSPDGNSATGYWLVMMFDILGPAHGFYGDVLPVAHRICRFKNTFVKENGVWKYKDILLERLFTPAFRSVQVNNSRGLINRDPDKRWNDWPKDYNKAPAPEDVFAVEEILSSWVTYIQNGSAKEWYENFLAVDSPDLQQIFMSRKPPYGEFLVARGLEGFSDFARLMDTGAKSQLKRHGIHAVSTPMVEVSPDGKYAVARSTEYGFTMFAGLEGVVPEPPFEGRPAVAVYEHMMEKGDDGKWRLFRFMWVALYQYSSFWFDPETTRGWTGTLSKRCWPLPYRKYIYSNNPADTVDELSADMGNYAFFEARLKPQK